MNGNYRRLHRSSNGRMIAGVCAGLGQYSKLDPTVIRLIGVPLVFISGPGMILAYLVMALIIVDASALPAD